MNLAISNHRQPYINKLKTIRIMKTIKFLVMSVVLSLSLGMQAQTTKQQKLKQTREELREKASKSAREEAKRLKKDGWQVSPGALPLERQLDRSYMFQEDFDEDMNPLYFIGEGRSIGENMDAAHIQATELARMDLAGKIGSEVTALVDNLVGNKQLAAEEAASITTTMIESKTIYSQKLGRVQVALEVNRTLKNKNKEVMVRLVAKAAAIKEIAKSAVREELEKKGAEMSDELKAILATKK